MRFILAHGALGIWDEVIFISIAAIFLAMMGISWVRSRVAEPDEHEDTNPAVPPEAATNPSEERFRLE
jgi:uncharacterized iron-regulated membrane protein